MNIRRFAPLGLVVLAGTVLLAGGCGTLPAANSAGAGGPTATFSSAAPTAQEVLSNAVTALEKAKFAFTFTQGDDKATGAIDAAARSGESDATLKASGLTIHFDSIEIGSDMWIRLDFGKAANKLYGISATKWMHIDATKIKSGTSLPLDMQSADMLDISGFSQAFSGVKAIDATHLAGTIDLNKVGGVLGPGPDELTKIKDKVTAVPFTATLDTSGRLVEIKIDATSIDKTMNHDIQFTYDSVRPITKPTGAIEASAKIYELLNS